MERRADAKVRPEPGGAEPPPARREPSVRADTKGRHLVRAAAVGLLAGLVAVAFRWALAESERSRGALLAGLRTLPHAERWAWMVLPFIGLAVGSAVGWLTLRRAPDAAGSGIPHLKGVLLHVRAMRWRALLPVKFVGGVLGIGAGLSMGREGPTVQMGAAIGQAVADLMHVPSRAVPQLLSCGAGAGVAAAFNAPLAGFLFVIEELHRELSARTFAGALVAAISADIVARALGGNLPSFAVGGYPPIPLASLPIAAAMGILGGGLAVVFNRSLLGCATASHRVRLVPRWMLPGVACALCGLVAWWLPEAVGGGHVTADRLLSGRLAWGAAGLAALLAAKFALTVVSYASGAPGGIFAPMLLMGAIGGAVVGDGVVSLFPALAPHATAFAILGMAAFFAGCVRAPLTGIVLIVEMTGNYHQLLALGVTCLAADLTAGAFKDRPIYEALLEADLRRRPPTEAHGDGAVAPRTVYVGIQRGSSLDGRRIREGALPGGCLIVSVERAGREALPTGEFVLLPGDHLMVSVPEDQPRKAMEVVRLATGL